MGESTKEELWDCHAHRDELCVSSGDTVYHPLYGQLCWSEFTWEGRLSFPIRFDTKSKAHNWIKRGTIAALQASMHTLDVGFQTTLIDFSRSGNPNKYNERG